MLRLTRQARSVQYVVVAGPDQSGLVTYVIFTRFEPNININAAEVTSRDCTNAQKYNGMTGQSASWVYTAKAEPVTATTDPNTAKVRVVSGTQKQVTANSLTASQGHHVLMHRS